MTKSERIATELNKLAAAGRAGAKAGKAFREKVQCDKCGGLRECRWLDDERHWMCVECEEGETCGGH